MSNENIVENMVQNGYIYNTDNDITESNKQVDGIDKDEDNEKEDEKEDEDEK